VNECALGKAAQPKALEQTSAVPAQARSVVRPAQGRLWMLALERSSGEAASTPTARLRERSDDVIADTDLRHVVTDGGHDSRNFVAEDGRRRRDVVCREEQVRMTQA
jgi:hypothetical protein